MGLPFWEGKTTFFLIWVGVRLKNLLSYQSKTGTKFQFNREKFRGLHGCLQNYYLYVYMYYYIICITYVYNNQIIKLKQTFSDSALGEYLEYTLLWTLLQNLTTLAQYLEVFTQKKYTNFDFTVNEKRNKLLLYKKKHGTKGKYVLL